MTETIQFGLISREDIRVGTGTFEATLADGRIVTLSALDVGDILNDPTLYTAITGLTLTNATITGSTISTGTVAPSTLTVPSAVLASLPTAASALARATDDIRGLFIGTATVARSLQGNVANVLDWGTDAAALQAAHDSLPSAGGTILIPSNTTIALGTTRVNFSKNIVLIGFGWTSKITADVTALADPGGNDRGILNIRHATSGSALDYVRIHNLWFDFGGSRASTHAEGRRGLNIYRAHNVDIRGNQFEGGVGEMVGLGNFDTPNGDRVWVIGNYFTDFAQDGINPNMHNVRILGNHFLTGVTGIEAGRDDVSIIGNHFEEMTSSGVQVASVINFKVNGNQFINCATTDPAGALGCINVAGGGTNAPSTDGQIVGNSFNNAATYANQFAINLVRGTSTVDNARIAIANNTATGIRQGIQLTSLLDGNVSDNILIGENGTGAGILLGGGAQVQRNAISGNKIRNYAARSVTLSSNGPITDSSAETDNNRVGWNDQENALVLGVSGRVDFTDLDATPSVGRPSKIYYVANSGATTITQLDDGTIGQELTLIFDDANTTINDAGNFLLSAAFTSSAGDTLTLVAQTATLWVEKSRSVN